MSYIDNNLSPYEELLLETSVSNRINIVGFVPVLFGLIPFYQLLTDKNKSTTIGAFFLMTIFFLMTLFILTTFTIRILTTEYAVTDKRVLTKEGLIRLNANEIRLSKIESVNVEKNLIQAILGIGNVTIRGTGGGKITLRTINNPEYMRYKITEIIEEYT